MSPRTTRSKGFSFVQVMVPMLIVTMAVIGLLTSFIMGRAHIAVARHRIQAVHVLRARLEELKSRGYEYLNTFSPNPTVETGVVMDTGQNEQSPNDDVKCTRATYITDNDGDGALEISLTVTWQERVMGGTQNYAESLFTVVAPTRARDS